MDTKSRRVQRQTQRGAAAGHLQGPFFTLTQLQEELNIDKRQNLRTSTVGRGAPYVVIGRETFFVTDSFVDWLRSRERVADPACTVFED